MSRILSDQDVRDHPLAVYIFARDSKVKKKVFESTQSGGVLANDVLLQVTGAISSSM